MEAILDRFLSSPGEYAAELELLRCWSFLSLGHYLPLWIFNPTAKLNIKPSRSQISPKFCLFDPNNLSKAVKTLLDSQLIVKLDSNNGDRIRLWDDATPQEHETLRVRLLAQNFPDHDDFLLDLLLLMETLAPQTHFYDIFSVQKRETAPHVRRLVPTVLKRGSDVDCASALSKHVVTSPDFGVFVTSTIVLSSVDSVWNKLPSSEIQLMETLIQHCEEMISRANEQGLFDSRRLRFHLDVAIAWMHRITGKALEAAEVGEAAARKALDWNAVALDAGSTQFSVIDCIEYSHAELLCICLESDPEIAMRQTTKLLNLIQSSPNDSHPVEYLQRLALELKYEVAILRRAVRTDTDDSNRVEAIKLFEEFNAGYEALEGPKSYHVALGLTEIIGIRLAQNLPGAYQECLVPVKRCLDILEQEIGPAGARQTELRYMLSKPSGWTTDESEIVVSVYLEGIDRAKKFYGKNTVGVWEAYRTTSSAFTSSAISAELKNSISQELITISAKVFGKKSKEFARSLDIDLLAPPFDLTELLLSHLRYAEALIFHAQIVGQTHAIFLPYVRSAVALLEEIGLDGEADRELIATGLRLLIRFYRARNELDKALETLERGLEAVGSRLDWPRIGLIVEKMDIYLAKDDGEATLNEAHQILAETALVAPEKDTEDVRVADCLIWLRILRAEYKLRGKEAFEASAPAAFDVLSERLKSCPTSRATSVDSIVGFLLDAAAIELEALASSYYDRFHDFMMKNLNPETIDAIHIEKFESFEARIKTVAVASTDNEQKEHTVQVDSAQKEEEIQPLRRGRRRNDRSGKSSASSSSLAPVILAGGVAICAGILAGWAVLHFSRKRK